MFFKLDMTETLFLISLVSYFLGSIPFSFLVAKLYRKDLYKIGSKNIGAANVFRATGKFGPFILAFVGDIGKGALAILLAQRLARGVNLQLALFLAATFVVLGHNWPIFLKFKGGRGLASLLGVLIVLNWKILPIGLGITLFIIFLIELTKKKKIKLEGSAKDKLKSIFRMVTSQVVGRVLGIILSIFFCGFLFPEVLKISSGALILVGIKHIKRVKDFLKSQDYDVKSFQKKKENEN